jgi:glycosyltransferase involved in cell wall biosynthesis
MFAPQSWGTHGNSGHAEADGLIAPGDRAQEDTLPLLLTTSEWQALLASSDRMERGRTPVKLSILMCAYNEERTIVRAVSEVLAADYPCDIELIIVDDGSTDATPTLLRHIRDPRITLHSHPGNRGKGAALRSAAAIARGTHILPFDADLEYSPGDIERLVHPVLAGRCDVVYGARIFGFNTVYRSYRYALGNRLLTRMANILFDAYLSDLHTCLKLIPLAMFRNLNPTESGFGLDTEVTALLLKAGVRPFEVPVSYYSRSHEDGKKITWRDAIACMAILVRVRLRHSPRGKAVLAAGDHSNVRALSSRDNGSPSATATG